jgi:hypothetical protein
MKLQPVLVTATRREPRSMTTQRAVFLCVSVAVVGAVVGGSFGWRMGQQGSQDGNDTTYAWLKGLANPETPIATLIENYEAFVYLVPRRYPDDVSLWNAIGRIVDEVVANPALEKRAVVAADLAECLAAHAGSGRRKDLLQAVDRLRRIAGR